MTIQGHSTLHLRSPRAQDTIRAAHSTSIPNSPIEGSLEWLWYSPTSVFDHLSDSGSPTLIQTPVPRTSSPSPPRIPLRPNYIGRGGSLGRSTPLLGIRRHNDLSSPHSFALGQFTDIRVEDESPSRPFIPNSHDPVTSALPPPILPLLLAKPMSSSLRRRSGWRRWWRGSNFSTSSCVDLLSSHDTGPRVLPSRVSALRDIARRRFRKKLEERRRKLDGSASD